LDLVTASQSAHGKILNALDLPLPISEHGPANTIASDLFAYITNGTVDQDFPRSSTRWALAATRGAVTGFHIDTDGMATYIQCVSRDGGKWWIVASPLGSADSDQDEYLDFAALLDVYNDDVSKILSKVRVEAILLQEGTRLYVSTRLWYVISLSCILDT
jgi:hypothetical protein